MPKQDKTDQNEAIIGPVKGDFIAPPVIADVDERTDALPQQEEFWKPPTRFGSVPVEKEPLGWDRRKGFRKLFPQVMLPFQVVERVQFGHPAREPNRLLWGDNLHVMRQLPSESIDLIYLDPPFFSGRNYNGLWRSKRTAIVLRYLGRRDARLPHLAQRPPLRNETLAQKTGSIYVHCDWHASHHIRLK